MGDGRSRNCQSNRACCKSSRAFLSSKRPVRALPASVFISASAKCGVVFDFCVGLCKILEKLKRLTVCVAGPALQGSVNTLPCRAFVLHQRIQVAATLGKTAQLCNITSRLPVRDVIEGKAAFRVGLDLHRMISRPLCVHAVVLIYVKLLSSLKFVDHTNVAIPPKRASTSP
jgi:hypothetical protein